MIRLINRAGDFYNHPHGFTLLSTLRARTVLGGTSCKKPVIARAFRARGERSERRRWRMKRGNRRSAACGRISEAISRKCPDWRPRQWPGIGWHDGGPERVAAVKIGGARHKTARKFCPPQQGHPHSLALHPLSCRPRVTFCHQRQKVTKERRQNPWF